MEEDLELLAELQESHAFSESLVAQLAETQDELSATKTELSASLRMNQTLRDDLEESFGFPSETVVVRGDVASGTNSSAELFGSEYGSRDGTGRASGSGGWRLENGAPDEGVVDWDGLQSHARDLFSHTVALSEEVEQQRDLQRLDQEFVQELLGERQALQEDNDCLRADNQKLWKLLKASRAEVERLARDRR